VRLGKAHAEDDGFGRCLRIDRFPRLCERARPKVGFETFGDLGVGDIGGGHVRLAC
jgi:hypothetical protein